MTEILLFIFTGFLFVSGVWLGYIKGYNHGFRDGKRDMSNFINKNTRRGR